MHQYVFFLMVVNVYLFFMVVYVTGFIFLQNLHSHHKI